MASLNCTKGTIKLWFLYNESEHSLGMQMSSINHYTKDQTAFLKGVGILLIVLHNFYHNLTPHIGENEFAFAQAVAKNALETLIHRPGDSLKVLFSYFGHYGVQLFIFFSTYGLTRKYLAKPPTLRCFLANRFNKIYVSFLLCVALYVTLGLLKSTFLTHDKVLYWDSLLWKVLLISNFMPGQAMMPVGPWWFMPFIFQVYLLYPWLLTTYLRYGYRCLAFLAIASLLGEWLLNRYLIANALNINFTVLGHLPVLCLGIVMARQKTIAIPSGGVVAALLLVVLGGIKEGFWLLGDVAITVLMLAASRLIMTRSLTSLTAKVVIFYGNISFPLFMVNGFLRTPFHQLAESYHLGWLDNLSALASLLFSTLFAFLLQTIDQRLRSALINKAKLG